MEGSVVIVSFITSVVTVVIGGLISYAIQERKLSRDRSNFLDQIKTMYMAEEAVRKLLTVDKWKLRSFSEIKKRVGGFEDNELRQLLIRSGAIAFYDKDDKELWGLLSRNLQEI